MKAADVDAARLRAADAQPQNWMTYGRTYSEQRFSSLADIDRGNVGRLGLAWYADEHTYRGLEATPIVVDGVLYDIAPWNITTAYDATNGKVLWSYDPGVPREIARKACCDVVSRGLAVWRGKVIIATLDGRLIALDAATGRPVWSVNTFAAEPPWPYTITGAPRVFDGKVIIGNGGAEYGIRGYVTAYDADTGRELWRFYTVPGKPGAAAATPAERAQLRSWSGEWWKSGGGGSVWDSIVYDPELKLVYFGVGNGYRSPAGSDNLYLASIVALDAETGEYVWHYQEVPADIWDYDATEPMVLADIAWKGRRRKVLMQAAKDGFFYVLDRASGKLLAAERLVPTTWADHVDLATGRPVENPVARFGRTPVLVSPGAGGAHNFNPIAYSPITGLAYLSLDRSFTSYSTLGFAVTGYDALLKKQSDYAARHERSWLVAWDPVLGRARWRVRYPASGSGGTLVTAGGLVFQGTIEKTFAAYDAESGRKLWERPIQTVAIAGPVTYAVAGEQYVAVNAGWGGGRAHVQASTFEELHVSPARLLVFKLGGRAELPPLRVEDEAPTPPPTLLRPPSPAELSRGEALYARHCARCHGVQARGGIKDLRHMSPQAHAHFLDIVLGGARAKAGMASFADVLSPADARAIHDYLIVRANEDWGKH